MKTGKTPDDLTNFIQGERVRLWREAYVAEVKNAGQLTNTNRYRLTSAARETADNAVKAFDRQFGGPK